MKKLLMMLLITASIAGTAMAQGKGKAPKSPEERATKRTEVMAKKLKLNPEQVSKVKDINLATAAKVDEIRGRYATEAKKKGMGKELKAAREERETQLKSILTDEQWKAYQTAKEQMKDKQEEPDAK